MAYYQKLKSGSHCKSQMHHVLYNEEYTTRSTNLRKTLLEEHFQILYVLQLVVMPPFSVANWF